MAPAELPKIGRAYLDSLLDQATSEGGFGHGAKLLASWQKLGPETKALLFKDPAYVRDLDNFFLLSKKLAANPNPSGTASTVMRVTEGGLLFTNPLTFAATEIGAAGLSSLLHSSRGVRLLTQGLRLPLLGGDSAAAAALAADLVKASDGAIAIPAFAGTPRPTPPNTAKAPATAGKAP